MHLVEELAARHESEVGMFRAQLLKEDVGRLQKLIEMADGCAAYDAYLKDGLYIGWTQNDMRTHELKGHIEDVLTAVFEYRKGGSSDDLDRRVRRAWAAFDEARMEKLVGCL